MHEQIKVTKIINTAADNVWPLISQIKGLERWFPIIDNCYVDGDGVGAMRTLELSEGGKMIDRIDEINHQQKKLCYTRVELPFPLVNYQGIVYVENLNNEKTKIIWIVDYDVDSENKDAMQDLIQGALTDGVNGLAKELSTQ